MCGVYTYTVHDTVGWSDLVLLAIFENGHIAVDQVYFYEFNSKKSANFAQFSFSKNQRFSLI